MIRLVKVKRDGDKQLITNDSTLEVCDVGVIVKFPTTDRRKPEYFGLIDEESAQELMNVCSEALQNIKARKSKDAQIAINKII